MNAMTEIFLLIGLFFELIHSVIYYFFHVFKWWVSFIYLQCS